MRIAICDDDLRGQNEFEEALQGWNPTRSAEKYFNGASLLETAKLPPSFDMVFIDIYMPGENGIEVAKALREISPETGIVFITASREQAVDAFSLYATHYLVKPATSEGIIESFRRLGEQRTRNRERVTLIAGRDRHTVFLD